MYITTVVEYAQGSAYITLQANPSEHDRIVANDFCSKTDTKRHSKVDSSCDALWPFFLSLFLLFIYPWNRLYSLESITQA